LNKCLAAGAEGGGEGEEVGGIWREGGRVEEAVWGEGEGGGDGAGGGKVDAMEEV
jgi:hypothetical protein